ncbi:DUF3429 domain-containing protein [Alphaproteobacteria bacterium]|nr:DUF3429 domain-containing protein [Alphaproteobacteria bacterium]
MQRDSLTIPQCAFWLGFTGLIPFVAAAALNFLPDAPLHDLALQALLSYGAVILSFLGGVRWGLAIATTDFTNLFGPLFISVVPALLGWFALLLPSSLGLTVLALGFSTMLVADLQLSSAPRWYRSLRLPLSVGAIVALLLGLFS